MTDPIASASIFIRPDTTGFRALLEAEIRKATAKPITIPVAVAPIAGGVTGTIAKATTATTGLAAATKRQAAAATQSAAATTAQARSMGQLQRGAASSALSMAGIRGATLAASGSFLAAAAAVTVFFKALGSAVSFESQLKVFAATTGATAFEMERVGAAAEEMGKDLTLPGISAGDAATAMTELAKAGLSVEDSIDGARGVLQLAIAANISFADATTLAASALNAFGLAGTEAVHVADILANAANAAQGSISDMGLALQQSAAVGRQVGLTLQDTTTFLTILAREGLRGSDAGTSLRVTLGRLINPTKKISAELERLGVSLRDARGNIRPDFFSDLGIAMQGMSKSQKDATLAILGGMDGMRALSILTRQSIDDVIGFRKQLDEQGTASELAQARMTGLAGASANLANTLQGIGLSIGQSVTPALTGLTNSLTEIVAITASAFSSLNSAINLGAILAAVAAFKLLPPILSAIAGTKAAFTLRLLASAAITGKIAGMAAAFRALLLSINPVAAAAALVATALFLLFTRTSAATSASNALAKASSQLSTAQSEQARTTREVADAQSALKTNELAVLTARLAAAQARGALAASQAAKGSIDRRILENQAAIAIDNVRIAENTLRDTRQRAADAVQLAAAAERTRQAAMAQTAELLDRINVLEEAGFISRNQAIANLEKEAAAQDALATKESVALAKRLRALAVLKATIDEVPTQKQIEVFLEDKNFRRGLKNLVVDLDQGGQDGGEAFTQGVLFSVNQLQPQMSAIMTNIFTSLTTGFANAGSASGSSFSQMFVAALQPAINVLQQLLALAGSAATAAVTTSPAQKLGLAEASGDTAGALAISRQRERMFERIRDRAKQKGDQTTFSNATDELIKAQNESNSLEQQLASEAAAGAKATTSAINAAEDAREKADQAIIDLFERREARIQIRIAVAEQKKGLADDIRAQVALKQFLIRQIAIFKERIKDAELERRVIADLRAKIVEVTGEISQLREDQRTEARERRAAREERKRERRDERLEGLRLNIQIAEVRENVTGEITARNRLINALIAARKNVKRGTNEWRRLTLEIEQERAAIRDLLKETKDRGKIAASLQFEFMRQQQGFAATLLGNLLPGNAALGTVGSGTTGLRIPGTGRTGGGKLPFATPFSPGRPTDTTGGRSEGIRTGLAAAGAPRGATQAQTGTMIDFLRGILRTLNGQKRNAAIPEAQYERAKASTTAEML